MRKICLLAVMCLLGMLVCVDCGLAAGEASQGAAAACPVPEGKVVPDLLVKGPLDKSQADYLGLPPDVAQFKLYSLKAPVLLVEVFSMYCPHCQREAPLMNEFYKNVEAAGLSGKIKILGIGAGNSEVEVGVFRDKFYPSFPIFADLDFSLHKSLGEVGTPFFYVLKREPGGEYKVVMSRLGRMDSPKAFLEEIVSKTGVKAEGKK